MSGAILAQAAQMRAKGLLKDETDEHGGKKALWEYPFDPALGAEQFAHAKEHIKRLAGQLGEQKMAIAIAQAVLDARADLMEQIRTTILSDSVMFSDPTLREEYKEKFKSILDSEELLKMHKTGLELEYRTRIERLEAELRRAAVNEAARNKAIDAREAQMEEIRGERDAVAAQLQSVKKQLTQLQGQFGVLRQNYRDANDRSRDNNKTATLLTNEVQSLQRELETVKRDREELQIQLNEARDGTDGGSPRTARKGSVTDISSDAVTAIKRQCDVMLNAIVATPGTAHMTALTAFADSYRAAHKARRAASAGGQSPGGTTKPNNNALLFRGIGGGGGSDNVSQSAIEKMEITAKATELESALSDGVTRDPRMVRLLKDSLGRMRPSVDKLYVEHQAILTAAAQKATEGGGGAVTTPPSPGLEKPHTTPTVGDVTQRLHLLATFAVEGLLSAQDLEAAMTKHYTELLHRYDRQLHLVTDMLAKASGEMKQLDESLQKSGMSDMQSAASPTFPASGGTAASAPFGTATFVESASPLTLITMAPKTLQDTIGVFRQMAEDEGGALLTVVPSTAGLSPQGSPTVRPLSASTISKDTAADGRLTQSASMNGAVSPHQQGALTTSYGAVVENTHTFDVLRAAAHEAEGLLTAFGGVLGAVASQQSRMQAMAHRSSLAFQKDSASQMQAMQRRKQSVFGSGAGALWERPDPATELTRILLEVDKKLVAAAGGEKVLQSMLTVETVSPQKLQLQRNSSTLRSLNRSSSTLIATQSFRRTNSDIRRLFNIATAEGAATAALELAKDVKSLTSKHGSESSSSKKLGRSSDDNASSQISSDTLPLAPQAKHVDTLATAVLALSKLLSMSCSSLSDALINNDKLSSDIFHLENTKETLRDELIAAKKGNTSPARDGDVAGSTITPREGGKKGIRVFTRSDHTQTEIRASFFEAPPHQSPSTPPPPVLLPVLSAFKFGEDIASADPSPAPTIVEETSPNTKGKKGGKKGLKDEKPEREKKEKPVRVPAAKISPANTKSSVGKQPASRPLSSSAGRQTPTPATPPQRSQSPPTAPPLTTFEAADGTTGVIPQPAPLIEMMPKSHHVLAMLEARKKFEKELSETKAAKQREIGTSTVDLEAIIAKSAAPDPVVELASANTILIAQIQRLKSDLQETEAAAKEAIVRTAVLEDEKTSRMKDIAAASVGTSCGSVVHVEYQYVQTDDWPIPGASGSQALRPIMSSHSVYGSNPSRPRSATGRNGVDSNGQPSADSRGPTMAIAQLDFNPVGYGVGNRPLSASHTSNQYYGSGASLSMSRPTSASIRSNVGNNKSQRGLLTATTQTSDGLLEGLGLGHSPNTRLQNEAHPKGSDNAHDPPRIGFTQMTLNLRPSSPTRSNAVRPSSAQSNSVYGGRASPKPQSESGSIRGNANHPATIGYYGRAGGPSSVAEGASDANLSPTSQSFGLPPHQRVPPIMEFYTGAGSLGVSSHVSSRQATSRGATLHSNPPLTVSFQDIADSTAYPSRVDSPVPLRSEHHSHSVNTSVATLGSESDAPSPIGAPPLTNMERGDVASASSRPSINLFPTVERPANLTHPNKLVGIGRVRPSSAASVLITATQDAKPQVPAPARKSIQGSILSSSGPLQLTDTSAEASTLSPKRGSVSTTRFRPNSAAGLPNARVYTIRDRGNGGGGSGPSHAALVATLVAQYEGYGGNLSVEAAERPQSPARQPSELDHLGSGRGPRGDGTDELPRDQPPYSKRLNFLRTAPDRLRSSIDRSVARPSTGHLLTKGRHSTRLPPAVIPELLPQQVASFNMTAKTML